MPPRATTKSYNIFEHRFFFSSFFFLFFFNTRNIILHSFFFTYALTDVGGDKQAVRPVRG